MGLKNLLNVFYDSLPASADIPNPKGCIMHLRFVCTWAGQAVWVVLSSSQSVCLCSISIRQSHKESNFRRRRERRSSLFPLPSSSSAAGAGGLISPGKGQKDGGKEGQREREREGREMKGGKLAGSSTLTTKKTKTSTKAKAKTDRGSNGIIVVSHCTILRGSRTRGLRNSVSIFVRFPLMVQEQNASRLARSPHFLRPDRLIEVGGAG